MSSISDLVRDSRLEASFHGAPAGSTDGPILTSHMFVDTGTALGQRSVQRREIWRREKFIGRGSYGSVWLEKCVDSRVGKVQTKLEEEPRVRAVKQIIRPSKHENVAEYNRELESIAKFSHRNYNRCFVESFGWYEWCNSLLISMEYLPDGDMEEYLQASSQLPEPEAQQVTYQILEGLSLMHQNSFVHRDIKPNNILIKSKPPNPWWVKIGDFGISRRADEVSVPSTLKGTWGFIAPELHSLIQRESPPPIGSPDMWSLGETVFRMLTREKAFRNFNDLVSYAQGKQPLSMTHLSENGVSEIGLDFINSLMMARPEKRPTAEVALDHEWLASCQDAKDHSRPSSLLLADLANGLPNTVHSEVVDEPSGEWTKFQPDKDAAPLSQSRSHSASGISKHDQPKSATQKAVPESIQGLDRSNEDLYSSSETTAPVHIRSRSRHVRSYSILESPERNNSVQSSLGNPRDEPTLEVSQPEQRLHIAPIRERAILHSQSSGHSQSRANFADETSTAGISIHSSGREGQRIVQFEHLFMSMREHDQESSHSSTSYPSRTPSTLPHGAQSIWQQEPRIFHVPGTSPYPPHLIKISQDGAKFVGMRTQGQGIFVRDALTGLESYPQLWDFGDRFAEDLAISARGEIFACVTRLGFVGVKDLRQSTRRFYPLLGQGSTELKSRRRGKNSVSISSDGLTVASCNPSPGQKNQPAALRNSQTGEIISELPIGTRTLAYSPEGSTLFAAVVTRSWFLDTIEAHSINTVSGRLSQTAKLSKKSIITGSSVSIASFSGFVAIAHGKEIDIIDQTSNSPITQMETQDGALLKAIEFSPDGLIIATGDKMVKLWDMRMLRQRKELPAHSGKPSRGPQRSIKSIVFSPDSKKIATTAKQDADVITWDAT